MLRLENVNFDARDHTALAAFWCEALGWEKVFEAEGEISISTPGGDTNDPSSWQFPDLVFVPVPEPEAGRDRVHLDLASHSVEEQQATVARLIALGATHADVGQAADVPWVVPVALPTTARTASTSTSPPARTTIRRSRSSACSRWAPPGSTSARAPRSRGWCWPTRRATRSASSPPGPDPRSRDRPRRRRDRRPAAVRRRLSGGATLSRTRPGPNGRNGSATDRSTPAVQSGRSSSAGQCRGLTTEKCRRSRVATLDSPRRSHTAITAASTIPRLRSA